MEPTRQSLLLRLKNAPTDAAWEEFYQAYWVVILSYAQKLGLEQHSAEDVLQETMVALMRILPRFEYRPERGKFRNFVFTITHRKTQAALRRARRMAEIPLDGASDDDRPSLAETLADEKEMLPSESLDVKWQESLQEEALRRLLNDPTIKGQTLEVFKVYVLQNVSAEEVAAKFGIAKNNVFQIKNRLIKKFQEEIKKLTDDLDESA